MILLWRLVWGTLDKCQVPFWTMQLVRWFKIAVACSTCTYIFYALLVPLPPVRILFGAKKVWKEGYLGQQWQWVLVQLAQQYKLTDSFVPCNLTCGLLHIKIRKWVNTRHKKSVKPGKRKKTSEFFWVEWGKKRRDLLFF